MTANPTLLSMPLAQNGQKNVIPTTQATAGDGLFSQSTGFPAETSLPLGAGGVAPSREDFNGLANLLGGVAFMAQKGFTFNYDATQDYYKGCIVIDPNDGNRYLCVADMTAGTVAPSADTAHDYWIFYPVGVINKRDVITTSGTYTAPVTGWYHIICIGGGGCGGNGGSLSSGGLSGTQGGTSSFGSYVSAAGGHSGGGGSPCAEGGGGAAGEIAVGYVQLNENDTVPVTVGAGGVAVTSGYSSGGGANGSGGAAGGTNYVGGQGAISVWGSGNTGNSYTNAAGTSVGTPFPTAIGGTNGTNYGGGGGGGLGNHTSPTPRFAACGGGNGSAGDTIATTDVTYGKGGDGGDGAIIIEYFA